MHVASFFGDFPNTAISRRPAESTTFGVLTELNNVAQRKSEMAEMPSRSRLASSTNDNPVKCWGLSGVCSGFAHKPHIIGPRREYQSPHETSHTVVDV